MNVKSKSRLLVFHQCNPPPIMPLLEIMPSPEADATVVQRALEYWKCSGPVLVVVGEETGGFIANRLAFALLREPIHLISGGVLSAHDVDRIVENSMGPRWMTTKGQYRQGMGGVCLQGSP